ncbi:glycosyltransferase [Microbacterium ulmi]|uniref:Glycosyltransferase n=1 Tax=Microbacterium ulmi TaxID=179095 RepID=A0A7Y2Q0G6_9MICO|nr:glycosyltransferase involved in cell wall biosynthesis [Microbacterium ulmi]NNH03267.1 glycosyltransferase [Microbacterium ulmi]
MTAASTDPGRALVSASLVVCTTGRSDRMPGLVARLQAALRDQRAVSEAVVVDNSPEGSLSELAGDGIRVVRAALPGLSLARTVGCIQARGDVLVFTDDDVEFAPSWPGRMAAPILAGELDATAAPVRLGPEFDDIASPLLRGWLAEANLPGDAVRLVGAGMALHRDLLGLGVWDQRLGAGVAGTAFGEETLFESMIRAQGARIDVVADAEVVHHPDATRLGPDYWRRTAQQKGLSEAYFAYHWLGETMPRPALRTARRRVRLWVHRRRHGSDPARFEQELRLIHSLAVSAGFSRESRSPRAYPPRAAGSPTRATPSVPAASVGSPETPRG